MLRNIIIKILKNKNKEKMLEAIREKQSGVLEVYTVLNDCGFLIRNHIIQKTMERYI